MAEKMKEHEKRAEMYSATNQFEKESGLRISRDIVERMSFETADRNRDGRIGMYEFERALGDMVKKEWPAIIKEAPQLAIWYEIKYYGKKGKTLTAAQKDAAYSIAEGVGYAKASQYLRDLNPVEKAAPKEKTSAPADKKAVSECVMGAEQFLKKWRDAGYKMMDLTDAPVGKNIATELGIMKEYCKSAPQWLRLADAAIKQGQDSGLDVSGLRREREALAKKTTAECMGSVLNRIKGQGVAADEDTVVVGYMKTSALMFDAVGIFPKSVFGFQMAKVLPGERAGPSEKTRAGFNGQLPSGTKDERRLNAYFVNAEKSLYGETTLPQDIAGKVVLTKDERADYEAWKERGVQLSQGTWSKVRFSLGITDTTPCQNYRKIIADKYGFPEMLLVPESGKISGDMNKAFQIASSGGKEVGG
ncbi:MAG: hypothetical protein ACP5NX_03695 [Candidatus Bilamarchaeaceae archaeon]